MVKRGEKSVNAVNLLTLSFMVSLLTFKNIYGSKLLLVCQLLWEVMTFGFYSHKSYYNIDLYSCKNNNFFGRKCV